MGDVSANFNRQDFTCRCQKCSALGASAPATKQTTIDKLQRIRTAVNRPLVVTRGVSCAEHNASVGGAKDSRHLPQHADAVDIAVANPQEAWQLVDVAMTFTQGFSVIRVYPHHVHLDDRPGPKRFLASPE